MTGVQTCALPIFCIFVDGSNLYHGLKKTIGKTQINFYEFSKLLCTNNRRLVRTYYYNAPRKQEDGKEKYKAQQKFFGLLYKTPYLEVKLGRLERRNKNFECPHCSNKNEISTYIEKGVDIALATDMLKFATDSIYDTAILVTGDGDFAMAVYAVKDLGKNVELAYVRGFSKQLQQACDKITTLDENFLKSCFI